MPDPSASMGLSLERILDSSPLQFDRESLIDGATRVGFALVVAARKLAAAHNSSAWPLSVDLTTKVFAMLDTESVCCAAATCALFHKCALDPLCYAHIDLTRSVAKVSDSVVSTMIQRAGNSLKSIKLGRLPLDEEILDESPLTGSCLSALMWNGGVSGSLLRQLHLYNLETPGSSFQSQGYRLLLALSACRSLVELEIVGIEIELEFIFEIVCEHCHSIERLCLDNRAIGSRNVRILLEDFELKNMIKKCPLLSSLAIRGYKINDYLLSALIKGVCGMKCLDLSDSFGFSGAFLRILRERGGTDSLKTLILRDCRDLDEDEVTSSLSCYYWRLEIFKICGYIEQPGSSGFTWIW